MFRVHGSPGAVLHLPSRQAPVQQSSSDWQVSFGATQQNPSRQRWGYAPSVQQFVSPPHTAPLGWQQTDRVPLSRQMREQHSVFPLHGSPGPPQTPPTHKPPPSSPRQRPVQQSAHRTVEVHRSSESAHCSLRQKQPPPPQLHTPEQQSREYSQARPSGAHRCPQGATQAVPSGLPSQEHPQASPSARTQRLPSTPSKSLHVSSSSQGTQTPYGRLAQRESPPTPV
jgi:hypothetical protein